MDEDIHAHLKTSLTGKIFVRIFFLFYRYLLNYPLNSSIFLCYFGLSVYFFVVLVCYGALIARQIAPFMVLVLVHFLYLDLAIAP